MIDLAGRAVTSFVAVVLLVQLLGAWTLVLHRTGALHRLIRRTAVWTGARALFVDVPLAAASTWCGCMSHGAVHALFHGGRPARAARFLALSSTLRCTAAIALAAARPSLAALGATLVAIVAWALLVERKLGAAPISPASVFLDRRSDAPVLRAFTDAWVETKQMVRRYALHLAVPAVLCAAIWSSSFSVDPAALSVPAWALLGAVLGALMPMDLASVLPLVVVLALRGVPFSCIAPFAIGVEAGALRSLAVADAYLTIDARRRFVRLVRAAPFAVALALCIVDALG